VNGANHRGSWLAALAGGCLLAGCVAGGTRSLPVAPAAAEGPPAIAGTAPSNAPAADVVDEPFDALGPDEFGGLDEFDGQDELEGPGELEPVAAAREPTEPVAHPLKDVPDGELERLVLEEPDVLGSASLGATNRGAVLGAVQMPDGPLWNIVNPRETWGTRETVDYLVRTIEQVAEEHPGTRPLDIGDIGTKKGGHLRPHVSHQSGRDVDVGFYYTTETRWYTAGGAHNLDLPRMWSFLRATVTETDVEAVFLDRSIQRLLREYAESIGEEPQWLDRVFGGESATERALVLHEEGHETHFHIRYYNPVAQETGRRIYPILLRHKKISPPTYYVKYKARSGDSLIKIARRFKTSVEALKKANRLRSNRIYAQRTYRIPRRGGVRPDSRPLSLPPRRLPAAPVAVSGGGFGDPGFSP